MDPKAKAKKEHEKQVRIELEIKLKKDAISRKLGGHIDKKIKSFK